MTLPRASLTISSELKSPSDGYKHPSESSSTAISNSNGPNALAIMTLTLLTSSPVVTSAWPMSLTNSTSTVRLPKIACAPLINANILEDSKPDIPTTSVFKFPTASETV